MIRRLVLIPLAVAALSTGCSTFDTDVVARVDDAALTRDELRNLIDVLRPGLQTDADTAREMINVWVVAEAIQGALAEDGIEIDGAIRDAATTALEASGVFEATDEATREQFIDWQAAFDAGLAQGDTYGTEAVSRAETWIKPRFGQIDDGTVLPLALDPALAL